MDYYFNDDDLDVEMVMEKFKELEEVKQQQ